MRNIIAIVIAVLAAALIVCAVAASRSKNEIGPKITNFLISLLPPVIGNFIIIVAQTETLALFGRYLYAVGIDITMYCLLDFILQYCGMTWHKVWQRVLQICIIADIIQFVCNLFFHHAFVSEVMMAYGAPYYNVRSLIGRNIHLGLIYVIVVAVVVVLLLKAIRGTKIYSEKYSIMLILLMFVGAWELFYIFSRTPVKASIIAYCIFGILCFYFSLYYRPRRLLNHLLADLVSDVTDGLFFFDDNGKCVWAYP